MASITDHLAWASRGNIPDPPLLVGEDRAVPHLGLGVCLGTSLASRQVSPRNPLGREPYFGNSVCRATYLSDAASQGSTALPWNKLVFSNRSIGVCDLQGISESGLTSFTFTERVNWDVEILLHASAIHIELPTIPHKLPTALKTAAPAL